MLSNILHSQTPTKTYMYVGSFTANKPGDGIYVYEFNTDKGELNEVQKIGNIINPSYLTVSPNGKNLYACTETQLERNGSVSAFKIDPKTGKITFLNKQSAGGKNPVYVVVDSSNKYVFNGNYDDAGVCVFECNSDGSLNPLSELIEFEGNSIIQERQKEAHVHSVNLSTDSKYLFAPDLGADKIRVLTFDKDSLLTVSYDLEVSCKKGSGPRHFTFHPNNKFAYCVEELSGTVSTYKYKNGQLDWIDSNFSYSKKQDTYGSADIHISPDGKFLYVSNRWIDENTITIFKINQSTGILNLVGHSSTFGNHPRNFVIDPTGKFLLVANQNSNSIIVLKRDMKTGVLTKTKTEINVKMPSCLKMIKY